MKAFREAIQAKLRNIKRRASARQAAIIAENKQKEETMNTRQLRRRSGIEPSSSQSNSAGEAKQTPNGRVDEQAQLDEEEITTSPVISARSLRSANKTGQFSSPDQTTKAPSTTSGRAGLANNKSPQSLKGPDVADTPSARATRSSLKQVTSPTQSDSITVSNRRASLREPVVKNEAIQDEPQIEPKSLRSSTRKKSVVVVEAPDETVDVAVDTATEGLDSSQSSQKRLTRRSLIKEPDFTTVDAAPEPSASPKTTRSSAKVVNVPQAPLVKARREGNVIIVSGIKDWPVEQKSLRITLKTSLPASAASSGRKRTRGQADDLLAINGTPDGSPRKKAKGAKASAAVKLDPASKQSSSVKPAINNASEDVTEVAELQDSFDSSQLEDINSRANRAARRTALLEAATVAQADADADDDDDSSLSSAHTSQLGIDPPEIAEKQPSKTPPTPVSPNLLTESSLPPAFFPFPEVEKPESAFPDKAAYLLAQRYAPLPPLSQFLAALTSHPPSSRSTETLLKLATNTQRALQEWQDEYLELDLKTCAIAGPIVKKPVTGGRKPLDEAKWQAAKHEELFGAGSRLSALAKSRQATTNGQTRVMRERKARRGELDMLGGGQAGLAGSVPPSGAEDEGKGGRAQRARKPVKRFEDAIADAEKAPVKRRKRGLGDDGVRNSAPPAAGTGAKRVKRTSDSTAKTSDTDQEDDEAAKAIVGNQPRPQSTAPEQPSKLPSTQAAQPPSLNQQGPPQHAPPYYPAPPTSAAASVASTPHMQHMQHQYAPPPPIHQYYHRQLMPPPGYGPPPPHQYAQPPQPPPGYYAQPPSVSYGNQPHPQTAFYGTPYSHPGTPHAQPHPASHHQQPYINMQYNPTMPQPGPLHSAQGTSQQSQPPSAAAPRGGKGQLLTGAPRKRAPKTTNAKGQPHEKSETRSASMTAWWAARKAKMAVEKEAAMKELAINRAAAQAQLRAGGVGVMPMGMAYGVSPSTPAMSAPPTSAYALQSAVAPAGLTAGPPAPSVPSTPTRLVPNVPTVSSISATPTKQADAAPVFVAPPPPRKESLPPNARRGSGSLGPGERKGSTGMGGKRGML